MAKREEQNDNNQKQRKRKRISKLLSKCDLEN